LIIPIHDEHADQDQYNRENDDNREFVTGQVVENFFFDNGFEHGKFLFCLLKIKLDIH
jgi:hypothetical protein